MNNNFSNEQERSAMADSRISVFRSFHVLKDLDIHKKQFMVLFSVNYPFNK